GSARSDSVKSAMAWSRSPCAWYTTPRSAWSWARTRPAYRCESMAREDSAMVRTPDCRAQVKSSAAAAVGHPARASAAGRAAHNPYADDCICIERGRRTLAGAAGTADRHSADAHLTSLVGIAARMVHARNWLVGFRFGSMLLKKSATGRPRATIESLA